jgi:hypothetical protein
MSSEEFTLQDHRGPRDPLELTSGQVREQIRREADQERARMAWNAAEDTTEGTLTYETDEDLRIIYWWKCSFDHVYWRGPSDSSCWVCGNRETSSRSLTPGVGGSSMYTWTAGMGSQPTL